MMFCGVVEDGFVEIVMEDGFIWCVSCRFNGGYEFCYIID